METYTLLRHFADSWMLLAMVLFFAGVCIRVLLPRYRDSHSRAADSIFRNEAAPAAEAEEARNDR